MPLDPDQERIVNAPEEHTLVLAGPGSGKTFTMAERVRKLSLMGRRVLALSFTKKAATELKERIGDEFPNLFVGTFHSFCYRLLQKTQEVKVIPPEWKEQFFGGKRDLILAVDKARMGIIEEPWAEDLARTYQSFLDKRGMLDFDDLLTRARDLLEYPLFDHVIVDEAQDNNSVQYDLLPLLGRHITMIGDVDQSIYGFRGAAPQLVKRFQSEFDPQTYYMENNYRSARGICLLAQGIIQRDPHRFDKTTLPLRTDHGQVFWKDASSFDEEVAWAIECLEKTPNMTFLSRSNRPLKDLEEYLAFRLYPSHRVGGIWGRPGMRSLATEIANSDPNLLHWGPFWQKRSLSLPDKSLWEKSLCEKLATLRPLERKAVVKRFANGWPTLSTIHRSKGLEWDSVAILGLRAGEFPKESDVLEEEIRLFYVAVTRARNILYMLGDRDSLFGNVAIKEMNVSKLILRMSA